MSLIMLAALLSMSDTATAPAATPQAQPAKVKEARICKIDPAYTGTRMQKRKCMTEAEWAVYEQDSNSGDLKTKGAR
jgi:hypothetical protein